MAIIKKMHPVQNTFHIEVKAREYAEYDSVEALRQLLPLLHGKKWMHVGAGSNLVFLHDVYDGVVLHSAIRQIEEVRREDRYVWLKVGAGVVWDDLVQQSLDRGLYGLENLSLIPGEVGASAVQNVGAYGVEAADCIAEVHTLDAESGEQRIFTAEQCQYAYRSSIFKTTCRGRYIVTHVVYRLCRDFKPNLTYVALSRELEARDIRPDAVTAKQMRDVIVQVRRAKLPDPADTGSAGSFFMNPVVTPQAFAALQQQHPDAPHYEVPQGVKVPAGWLIQQCGWRGRQLGRAGVYSKQALVLVNMGGADGQDVLRLCQAIQHDVHERFGLDLHPEANLID